MNKNTLIGLLLAVVVIGGGYLLLRNKPVQPVVNQTSTNVTSDTTSGSTSTTGQASVPGAPFVETSQNAGTSNSTAIVTGQIRPNGAATTYWFDYGETTAFGLRSVEQSIGSGYSLIPTPTYITGLKANTQYYFRLTAKNRFATVSGAAYVFNTNSNPPPQGVAPTTHINPATSVSRTSANLNGQVNPNGSSTTYWFEYGKDTDLGNATTLQSAGSANSLIPVSLSLSNLDPLTKYYFRLNAQNQFGTVNSPITSFTTAGPAAPSQPTVSTTAATNVSSTSALLTGRVNPNGAETTYWFEYSRDSLLGTLIGTGTPPQAIGGGSGSVKVDATISGLERNTTYFYRIIGRNSAGTVQGAIVSFKTKS